MYTQTETLHPDVSPSSELRRFRRRTPGSPNSDSCPPAGAGRSTKRAASPDADGMALLRREVSQLLRTQVAEVEAEEAAAVAQGTPANCRTTMRILDDGRVVLVGLAADVEADGGGRTT